jgi:hypothetical protein
MTRRQPRATEKAPQRAIPDTAVAAGLCDGRERNGRQR